MKKIFARIIFYSYTLVLLAGTLTPAKRLPKVAFLSFDKLVHLLAFGAWAGLFFLYEYFFNKQDLKKTAQNAVVYGTVFGVIIEFLQLVLPINRAFEVGDMIADFIGSALAAVILMYGIKWIESLKKNKF